MNEQIKQLAEQAGFIRFSPDEDPYTPIDWSCDYTEELEKFAKLIVWECISIMESCDGDLDYAIWKTKTDFGIE